MVSVKAEPLTREQQKLVETNLGLARKIAYEFSKNSEDSYDDLLQIGCLGLASAVRRFDASLGFAFSSYACPFIKGEIQHWLRDQKDLIRTPRTQERLWVDSLDQSVCSETQTTRLDLIPSATQALTPEQEEMETAIAHLKPEMRAVIKLKYFQHLSGVEIAEQLSISPQVVCYRLKKATAQLKTIITEFPKKQSFVKRADQQPSTLVNTNRFRLKSVSSAVRQPKKPFPYQNDRQSANLQTIVNFLRSENERLKAQNLEHERLKRYSDRQLSTLQATTEFLRSENERLRSSVRELGRHQFDHPDTVYAISREAVAPLEKQLSQLIGWIAEASGEGCP